MRLDVGATPEQEKEINDWLTACGYKSLPEWMSDSDYFLKDGEWRDEDYNVVDPYIQAFHAKEASES